MTEQANMYLIAHKVRGEAAFDVAIQIECSVCEAVGCDECDDRGAWWISPTYGHRCYPYWSILLLDIDDTTELEPVLDSMPTNQREHFATPEKTKAKPKHDNTPSLAHALGLIKPLKRRI